MSEASTPTVRFVPGAPPPSAPSKSQKKKRSGKGKTGAGASEEHVEVPDATSAALIEKAPEQSDIKEGAVAPDLVVEPEIGIPKLPEDDIGVVLSPIVDIVSKRLKATAKKIVSGIASTRCLSQYAHQLVYAFCVWPQSIP